MLAESGRFEHLIYSFRPPTLISHSDELVACGLRVFVDSLLALLFDFISSNNVDLSSLNNTPLITHASIPKVVVYILNEQASEDAGAAHELDKLAMSVVGQLRNAGINSSLGKHEFLSRLVTQATKKNFLKSKWGASASIHQMALQFLATISIQTRVECIFIVHNSPTDPRKMSIVGCGLRDCLVSIYDKPTAIGGSGSNGSADTGLEFKFITLLQSELVPYAMSMLVSRDDASMSSTLGAGGKYRRRSVSDVSQDEDSKNIDILTIKSSSNAMTGEDLMTTGVGVSRESSVGGGTGSGNTVNSINASNRELVFFADKRISAKNKFKELRSLADKIKSQFLDFHGGTMSTLPLIIASELALSELRDVGTFLIRLSESDLSSSMDKGGVAYHVENYVESASKVQTKRAIKNFIADIPRVFLNVSTSNPRVTVQITSYSLQDEKFDQFFIPSMMIQKFTGSYCSTYYGSRNS